MRRKNPGGCPKREDFVRFFMGELEESARRNFLDHALHCPDCRPRLKVLAALQADLKKRESLVPEVGLTEAEACRLRRLAADERKVLTPARRRAWVTPAAATTAVSLAALGVLLGYYFLKGGSVPRTRLTLRAPEGRVLRLIEPGKKLQAAPTLFVWTEVKGVDTFLFSLIDDELNTIYFEAAKIPHLRLPDEVRQKLQRGKTYLWTVRAQDDFDGELASASRDFVIE
jgi:hypothetical protein